MSQVSPYGNVHRVFVGVYREPSRPNQRMPVFGLTEDGKRVDPPLCAHVGMFGEPLDVRKLVRVEAAEASS